MTPEKVNTFVLGWQQQQRPETDVGIRPSITDSNLTLRLNGWMFALMEEFCLLTFYLTLAKCGWPLPNKSRLVSSYAQSDSEVSQILSRHVMCRTHNITSPQLNSFVPFILLASAHEETSVVVSIHLVKMLSHKFLNQVEQNWANLNCYARIIHSLSIFFEEKSFSYVEIHPTEGNLITWADSKSPRSETETNASSWRKSSKCQV